MRPILVEILLVEDNDTDAELAIRALSAHRLVDGVHRVRDGAEALDFLLAARDGGPRPRVVLLDLKLPKVAGLDVLVRIKGDERLRDIPVVILTSSREDRDVAEGYRLGANSYIVKPLDFDEFSETVGRLGTYWLRLNEQPVEGS